MNDKGRDRSRNFLVVLLLIVVTLFTAFQEGYFPLISPLFWLCLMAGVGFSLWLAWDIANRRFLALILVIFILEYLKESIGIKSGMWVYHGAGGAYNFGVWAWVWAGLSAYTLSTRLISRALRRHNLALPRRVNLILVLALFGLIPLTLGKFWSGAGGWFWGFYITLLLAGLLTASRLDFPVFAGLVLAAWVLANPSEYVGSALSGIWTFTHNPHYPPFFLLAGCWPLEILVQYGLSAVLAREPLDQDTH